MHSSYVDRLLALESGHSQAPSCRIRELLGEFIYLGWFVVSMLV